MKPIYEHIRNLTVGQIKSYPNFVLDALSRRIVNEIERAELALEWLQSIKELKAMEGDDHE